MGKGRTAAARSTAPAPPAIAMDPGDASSAREHTGDVDMKLRGPAHPRCQQCRRRARYAAVQGAQTHRHADIHITSHHMSPPPHPPHTHICTHTPGVHLADRGFKHALEGHDHPVRGGPGRTTARRGEGRPPEGRRIISRARHSASGRARAATRVGSRRAQSRCRGSQRAGAVGRARVLPHTRARAPAPPPRSGAPCAAAAPRVRRGPRRACAGGRTLRVRRGRTLRRWFNRRLARRLSNYSHNVILEHSHSLSLAYSHLLEHTPP